MNHYSKPLIAAIALFTLGASACFADNPIIQTSFTADPAPMVYKDTVYLYTGHDEDDAKGWSFKMFDWKCYTTTDMANWTDHGTIASLDTFKWAGYNAWAPQCIPRNGKLYLYCPVGIKNAGMAIGVAVSSSPYGPFTDPLDKPLIPEMKSIIDPTVFIDDDGQAYLYWGNPDLYYVKLNADMISFSGAPVKVESKPANYQEGPWFYKRQGHYYLAYASTCCPEGIGYAMSDSPTGPWTYKGQVMDPNGESSGNHPGIIDYKGNSYVFGFNYALNNALTPEHNERRSVNVEQFTYHADGSIPNVPWWSKAGAPQIGHLNPYTRVEAETIAWSSGVKTESCAEGGLDVCSIDNGDYIKIDGVDFGSGAKSFDARVASETDGGSIEIHLDSLTGPLAGTCATSHTGGEQKWATRSCKISDAKGVHDVYFKFSGSGSSVLRFDWWKFHKK